MWKEEIGPKLRCYMCGDKEPKLTRLFRNGENRTRIVRVEGGHVLATGKPSPPKRKRRR